jgi:hypothetical protein
MMCDFIAEVHVGRIAPVSPGSHRGTGERSASSLVRMECGDDTQPGVVGLRALLVDPHSLDRSFIDLFTNM